MFLKYVCLSNAHKLYIEDSFTTHDNNNNNIYALCKNELVYSDSNINRLAW